MRFFFWDSSKKPWSGQFYKIQFKWGVYEILDNINVIDLFGVFSGKTQNEKFLNIKAQNATTQDEINAIQKENRTEKEKKSGKASESRTKIMIQKVLNSSSAETHNILINIYRRLDPSVSNISTSVQPLIFL